MKKTLVLVMAVLALSSHAFAADRKTEEAKLLETDTEFSKASVSNGVAAAFLSYLSDDATLLPAGGQPVTGKDAIREQLAVFAGSELSWKPVKAEVSTAADLGYTWGTYVFKGKDAEGNPRVSYGKYATIWRKQTDGSWKAILDVGNQSPPPTPETAR